MGGLARHKMSRLPIERDKRLKREIANSNERRRMQSINSGFQQLKALLPDSEDDKRSKSLILHQAVEYITKLEGEKFSLMSQNSKLLKLMQCEDSGRGLKRKRDSDDVLCNEDDLELMGKVERLVRELKSQLDEERKKRLTCERHLDNFKAIINNSKLNSISSTCFSPSSSASLLSPSSSSTSSLMSPASSSSFLFSPPLPLTQSSCSSVNTPMMSPPRFISSLLTSSLPLIPSLSSHSTITSSETEESETERDQENLEESHCNQPYSTYKISHLLQTLQKQNNDQFKKPNINNDDYKINFSINSPSKSQNLVKNVNNTTNTLNIISNDLLTSSHKSIELDSSQEIICMKEVDDLENNFDQKIQSNTDSVSRKNLETIVKAIKHLEGNEPSTEQQKDDPLKSHTLQNFSNDTSTNFKSKIQLRQQLRKKSLESNASSNIQNAENLIQDTLSQHKIIKPSPQHALNNHLKRFSETGSLKVIVQQQQPVNVKPQIISLLQTSSIPYSSPLSSPSSSSSCLLSSVIFCPIQEQIATNCNNIDNGNLNNENFNTFPKIYLMEEPQ